VSAGTAGDLLRTGQICTGRGGSHLVAATADIPGDALLNEGFGPTGAVVFSGAKIGGLLSCASAELTNAGGSALYAESAEISGDIFLGEGFSATGAVWLLGAKIGGSLDCSGATLTNEGGSALSADWAEINRGAYLVRGPGHCAECHSSRNILGGIVKDTEFAGAPNPEGTGEVPNITPSDDGLAGCTGQRKHAL